MKIIIAFCFTLLSTFAFSQDRLVPVTWSFEVEEVDGEYVFKAVADIDANWAVYSQHTSEGGPVPLSFTYEDPSILIGDTKEKSEAITKMSELFEIEVVKFKKKAVFEQRFTKKEGAKNFVGELRFMCCDELRCLPPTVVPFDVTI